MEYEKVVSNNFFAFINRLFTAVLLVVLLFACQQMPESNNVEGVELKYQAN